ncbi:DEAD/DEAH box helicase [Streptomyces sp. NBC_01334]|uniref:DEAD/DEAH box helicase n=1 Tax=Streptomyces sp. NBC_01334 TaxID=2903827 RepID=UPI002E0F698C|nr:DEAD/DEAH box helicase [Streptomyces sp. NBC_01334]
MGDEVWFLNPDWADLPLGRGEGVAKSARERYAEGADWVRRWSCYAQLMSAAAENWGRDEDVHEMLGDAHLRVYQDLISPHLLEPSSGERGRFLLDSVIRPVLTNLYDETDDQAFSSTSNRTRVKSREAICAWFWAIEARRSWKEAARRWQAAIPGGHTLRQPERTIRERMWAEGLDAPEAFPPLAAPGLRLIAERLDDALRPYARDRVSEGTDLLSRLLPASIAEKVGEASRELAERRAQYSTAVLENLGIDENGQTDLMAAALPRLLECIATQRSMLLLGPTSSGKSRIGRIAVCHAITRAHRRHGRAIVLMPTKALVSQAVEEWKEFLDGTKYEWRIVPGSRDYPHYDEMLLRGEYDVAVIIPEKLAGLMAGGMTLDGCDLIVVDELQNLADPDRGPRLEMLLTAIRASYQMPILGLSATLTEAAAEDVRRWLDISPDHVVRVTRRPVPLNMVVRDDRRVCERHAEDGRLEERFENLGVVLRQWRKDSVLEAQLDRAPAYERALAVAVKLLKDDSRDVRSVLCFVGSRQHAQVLAEVAQVLLSRDPDIGPVSPEVSLFAGRFGTLDEKDVRERHTAFFRFPQTTVRDSVENSVRTGVGYHSARLEQGLRSVVEKAFRDGLIRLLFATDTLKLGINLPADAVVVGSLTTPTGGRTSQVLNQDTVAQRLGRAGRLGLGTGPRPRGYGYLVIPHTPLVKSAVDFQEADLNGLASHVTPKDEEETAVDRALRALSDVTAVYRHYVDYTSTGATIASQVDEQAFAAELLHWAVQQRHPFTEVALGERLDALHRASLGAVSGSAAPDRAAVREILVSERLIGVSPGRAGDPESAHWVVTGLGRAVSTSGLPFADARVVEQLVAEAALGAGDLTLLWIAARSQHVRDTMSWLSVVPATGDDERERAQCQRVLRLAAVLGTADAEERDRKAGHLANKEFTDHLDERDPIGTGVVADQLRRLLTGSVENPGLDAITALLRACVMLLWMTGCPLSRITSAVEANTRVSAGWAKGPREVVAVHAADVRNLGENASYLFDAARELSGVRPQGTVFRRFESMAEAVELGVPSVLSPLARLPLPTTHRERIVRLVRYLPAVTAKGIDHLADVVDRFLRRPRKARDFREAQLFREFFLSEKERTEIRKMLDVQEQSRRRGLRLMPAFTKFRVPGYSNYRFADVLDNLSPDNVDSAPRDLAALLRAFGLTVEEDARYGMFTVSTPLDPGLRRRIAVHLGDFGVQQLVEARGRADIVVACGGVTSGVRLAFPGSAHNPVVVQPAIFLETLGRIMQMAQAEGLISDPVAAPAEAGSAIDDILGRRAEDGDSDDEEREGGRGEEEAADEDWVGYEGREGSEDFAEFEDFEEEDEDDECAFSSPASGDVDDGVRTVGHRLLTLLTAAPPLLGHSELNRLVAGLQVAPPPEESDDRRPVLGEN